MDYQTAATLQIVSAIVGILLVCLLLWAGFYSMAQNYEDRVALYSESMSQDAFDVFVLREENLDTAETQLMMESMRNE